VWKSTRPASEVFFIFDRAFVSSRPAEPRGPIQFSVFPHTGGWQVALSADGDILASSARYNSNYAGHVRVFSYEYN